MANTTSESCLSVSPAVFALTTSFPNTTTFPLVQSVSTFISQMCSMWPCELKYWCYRTPRLYHYCNTSPSRSTSDHPMSDQHTVAQRDQHQHQHRETPFDVSIRKATPRISPAVADTLESFEGIQNAIAMLDPASFGFLNRKWGEIREVRRMFTCPELYPNLLRFRDTINSYATPAVKLGRQEF